MTTRDIAVVVCTYQMPGHLARVLASLAKQTIAPRMEVVVSDDGSRDVTADVVDRFARQVPFPVQFITHPRDGFQLARCRNDGFQATTAPCVLFLDGDCLAPPDHVQEHLALIRPGVVTSGYCIRLDQPTSERITVESVLRGEFARIRPTAECRKLALMHYKAAFYNLIGHKRKPNLRGGNVGICRDDFLRVNGLDENFRAWGGEDDDLGWRMRAAGLQIVSVLHRTRTYHLWHPPTPTKVDKHHEQHHFEYLYRSFRLTRCLDGVVKRQPHELLVRLVGQPHDPPLVQRILRSLGLSARPWAGQTVDLEVVVVPGIGRFTGQADGNVLLALEESAAAGRHLRQAHLVLSKSGQLGSPQHLRLKLSDAAGLWAALGGRRSAEAQRRAA
jgi:GT2 family glycosyltransferase